MASYPKDQFDELPDDLLRVGAHRGPKVRGRGWILFAWAALATGLIVASGFYVIQRDTATPPLAAGGSSSTATAIPTAEPATDPTEAAIKKRKITITVLNGTATKNLEDRAGRILKKAKWTVGSKASASTTKETQTVVYYSDKKNEDVARGVAQALGTGTVRFSEAFQGAKLTIVLGKDFADAS